MTAHRLPPQSFFLVSAVFHYLGPSFAVLLFARVDVLGVAWLRIATAAVVCCWPRLARGAAGTWRRWPSPSQASRPSPAAMARLPRATFALMLALLPMFATVIGALVLGQIPTIRDLAGIALVIAGVALHRPAPEDGARDRMQSTHAGCAEARPT
jgi:inner membrane transporter RhtA